MAMLLAYRLTQIKPASFSLGMNDYGFELLTDSDFDFSVHINQALFSTENLTTDIYASTNYTEIARRRFRDIASIAGLLFKGFPKKQQKTRHLQANSNLFYEVFADYDPDNFLLRQSLEEALAYQLEESRLRIALKRMQKQDLLMYSIDQPTPFSFPILVDSMMRGKLTNEPLEERVKRMIAQMQEG
jgi:ATP-dependent Lhr-like helicase